MVGWLTGPFRIPSGLRGVYATGVGRLRETADERGLGTGQVGVWVHRRRSLVFGLIAVVAGIVVLTTKPLTVSRWGGRRSGRSLAVIVVTVVERPGEAPPLNRSSRTVDTERVPH